MQTGLSLISSNHSRRAIRFVSVLFLMTMAASLAVAQPGGPGGRPQGAPPSGFRPGQGGPGSRDYNPNQSDQRSKQVKKKVVGNTYKVVGTLRDSVSKEVMPFVNVAVLAAEDSSYVKAASTNMDGYFEVVEVPAGTYLLRVSYIGYQNKFVPFTVENNTALGTILMHPGAATLKAVNIKADRPLYAMDGEKMIYNVMDDPSIQTGTTTDALQNAPGVEVDVEGNITLRGVSSVEIWVNDRPSKLTAENLKTFLESLPANAVARIETITNPSAKYATESDAVINIVTTAHIKSNKFISFGVNGGTQPFVNPWLSYVWSKERLRISVYASGRYSYGENENSSSAIKKDTAFNIISRDSTYGESESRYYSGNLSMNISYEFDTMTNIDFWSNGNISRSLSTSNGWYQYDESMMPGGFNNTFDRISSDTNDAFAIHGGFFFTHKYNNEGKYIRVFGMTRYSDRDSWNYLDRDYTIYSNPLLNSYHRWTSNRTNSFSSDMKVRYNNPLSENIDLSFGLGAEYESDNKVYDLLYMTASGLYDSIDALRAFNFHESEYEMDGDVNLTRRWGNFTAELGLGFEYKQIHFVYEANPNATIQYPFLFDDTTYNFFTLRPSIHLTYRTEKMHNYKLNYSLRMHNPSTGDLTTFRYYSDDSYSVGNRDLKAYYTHQAEAGWSKYFNRFGNVGLEAYARYTTNEVNDLTDITDGVDEYLYRIVQYTTPYNMGMSYRYGLSANVMYRPTAFFNLRLYGNLYHSGYEMYYDKLGETVTDGMTSYSLRLNLWTKVLDRYQIYASANYTSPTQSLFATRKARYSLDFGLRSDFFKRRMSAYINVRDIFNWGAVIGGGSTNTNPYYISNQTSKTVNSRYISAGLTFRFGKMELESKAASETTGQTSTESQL